MGRSARNLKRALQGKFMGKYQEVDRKETWEERIADDARELEEKSS